MGAIITLTTDFGSRDAYVGTMKGVILGLNPLVTLVDLSHEIEPGNILQAAFLLSTTVPYFPSGTVHLVVVDPGVGTGRRLPPGYEAVRLTESRFWLSPLSDTFHGRDLFAPVAAHISQGVPLKELIRTHRLFRQTVTNFV